MRYNTKFGDITCDEDTASFIISAFYDSVEMNINKGKLYTAWRTARVISAMSGSSSCEHYVLKLIKKRISRQRENRTPIV